MKALQQKFIDTFDLGSDKEKQKAVFQQRIDALNQRIFQYNLQAPSPQFHRQPLNPAYEINVIQSGDGALSSPAKGR